MNGSVLTQLAIDFASLSLLAVGGANSLLPEIHRNVVEVHGWMTSTQFAELYAIAQASPGPNVLVVTLIGWKVAGLAGAAVTTAAMCTPACLLAFAVARIWDRFHGAPWRTAVQNGLAPITVALMLASGYFITRGADQSWPAYALTAATVVLMLRTRLNPLWMIVAGALIGLTGFI